MQRLTPMVITAALLVASCGGAAGFGVDLATYRAIVPSDEQLQNDNGMILPGGFAVLRNSGIELVEMRIDADDVTFVLDARETTTRSIAERLVVRDSEGSGPFKAEKEVLVLDGGPLELGGLTITEPVVWPGSFEESPVVTLKQRNPDERGPTVSCRADEMCLLLSSGVDPRGTFEDANDPELEQNPIATIEITDGAVEFVLDDGERIRADPVERSTTRACGISETTVWEVPPAIGLAMEDPVLVHTLCPTSPGAAIQLVILERAAMPLLAATDPPDEGDWCQPSLTCLWFAPITG